MSERAQIVAASGKVFDLAVLDNAAELGRIGADLVQQAIDSRNGSAVLCFATGSTPLPVYEELIRRHAAGKLSFKGVHAFMLDEYHGLPADHANSFKRYMEDHLFSRVDIPTNQVHGYEGHIEDHMQICFRYERMIAELGGIELMLLGIGRNGHIAFNEPGCSIDSRCRLIKLTEDTRKANARFFGAPDEVPRYALSMGIANILEAKSIMMMATGANKSEAVFNMIRGPVDSQVPASFLQMYEGKCTFLVDQPAAAELLEYRRPSQR